MSSAIFFSIYIYLCSISIAACLSICSFLSMAAYIIICWFMALALKTCSFRIAASASVTWSSSSALALMLSTFYFLLRKVWTSMSAATKLSSSIDSSLLVCTRQPWCLWRASISTWSCCLRAYWSSELRRSPSSSILIISASLSNYEIASSHSLCRTVCSWTRAVSFWILSCMNA